MFLINIYGLSKIRFTIISINFKLCIIELHIALAIGILLIILNNLSNDNYIQELVSKILTICFGIILILINFYICIKNIKLYKKINSFYLSFFSVFVFLPHLLVELFFLQQGTIISSITDINNYYKL